MTEQYVPFRTGMVAHTVVSCGLSTTADKWKQVNEGVPIEEGKKVPGCMVFLGRGLEGSEGFAILFHMPGVDSTLSSYEYGGLKNVLANVQTLIFHDIISDAYIIGMKGNSGSSSLASDDPDERKRMNDFFDSMELEILSADPGKMMEDDSVPVKLAEYLISVNGDWTTTVNQMIDSIIATILEYCPGSSFGDTAEAVIRIRKDLINSFRNIFL